MKKNQDEPVDAAELRGRAEDDELERRVQERTAELAKANEALRIEITGHKRAEEEIQDLSKFPSENPNPVLRIARDGTLLYINEAGLRRLPQWHLEVGHPGPPVLREAVFQSMDSGPTQELHLEYGERVYSFFVAPVVAAGYANLYGRDITERKRADAALRESEARFRAIASHTPDHIFMQDRDLRYSFVVNPQLGLTEADIIGKTERDILGKEDAEKLIAIKRKVMETGEPFQLETSLQNSKGQTEFFEGAYIPMFDATGKADGLIGYFRNITERKRAEVALRDSRNMLQTVLDSIPSAVFWKDRDSIYLGGNRSWLEAAGLKSSEEVVGKSDYDLPWEKEQAGSFREHDRRIIESGIPEYDEIEPYLRGDGTQAWAKTNKVPLRDTDGDVVGVLGIYEDITDRMRAEERMRRFSHEIIAAREEERKRVSSVLHHDVGSLAVGVSAHLDAIEGDLRSGKPGEALEWTKRTRKLFDESVARLKEVAVQLRPPELDVLGLRAALRQHFSRVTKHGGTRIHFRETLGRRRVSGDAATTLFRVAQETLTNAITHGDAKQVDVFLSASKNKVKLTVRDNGKGFSPSGQKGQATSRMGLRVMKEMAASSGGGFEIRSRRGKGTTVRVSLPLTTAAREPRPEKESGA